jgi:hypothetical protein
MSAIRTVIRRHLVKNYGELIAAAEPEFDEKRRVWEVKLYSNYPRIIRDDREPDRPVIRFFFLDDIGRVIFDEGFSLVSATSRDDLVNNIRNRNAIYRERAEKILVKASADNLSQLSEAMHALNPVKVVVDALVKPVNKAVITYQDIEHDDKPQRLRQYLEMMKELELVREVEEGYTYGPQLEAIMEKAEDDLPKLRQMVVAYIIRKRYSILRDVFDITQFERYVHLGNCYYWPSLDAEKLIYTTKDKLYQRYLEYYGNLSPVSFPSLLEDLVQVNALHIEQGKYCYGNDELFEQMLKDVKSSSEANPPSA